MLEAALDISTHRNGYHSSPCRVPFHRKGYHSHRKGYHSSPSRVPFHRKGYHTHRKGYHSHRKGYHKSPCRVPSHRAGYHFHRKGYHFHRAGYHTKGKITRNQKEVCSSSALGSLRRPVAHRIQAAMGTEDIREERYSPKEASKSSKRGEGDETFNF